MKKIILITTPIIILISISCWFFYINKSHKEGFVNMEIVYSDFLMTKDLSAKFENIKNSRQYVLDSLKIRIQSISQLAETKSDNEQLKNDYNRLMEIFQYKEYEFYQDNESLSKNYNSQIQTRLKQYIKEYAELNNFYMIMGSGVDGGILYAKDDIDITKDVVSFINNKYKGK